jgi:hypothetical protein
LVRLSIYLPVTRRQYSKVEILKNTPLRRHGR